MENLLLLLTLIACPLGMALLGFVGWTWAKMRSAPATVRERLSDTGPRAVPGEGRR
jgi:hypothetical protein